MIVLDASAAVALLLNAPALGGRVRDRIRQDSTIHVPELFDLEVLNALRGILRRGEASEQRVGIALVRLTALPLTRHAHWPFTRRVWQLRQSVSAYDAVYVALAESLRAPIVTLDSGLARVGGSQVDFELID